MVVVSSQESYHEADLVPLERRRNATDNQRHDASIDCAPAACSSIAPQADANGHALQNGIPSCARMLHVLERGRQMLLEMERGEGRIPLPQPNRVASTVGSAAGVDLCWSCRTRHEAKPSPATIHHVLEGAIRRAVLPRLQALHGSGLPPVRRVAARIADRLLTPSLGISRTIDAIEAIAQPYGWSVTSCAPLFEECARNLGDRCTHDACDEAQLTTALLILQAAIDTMVEAPPSLPEPARSALVVTPPGELHRLGAQLAERALQHAGWQTTNAASTNDADLADSLAADTYDALHIALSCAFRRDHWQARLARLIATARAASRTSRITVSVGGRLFSEAPAAWSTVGADTGSTSSATLARAIVDASIKA